MSIKFVLFHTSLDWEYKPKQSEITMPLYDFILCPSLRRLILTERYIIMELST
jgi:hypothetical protein